MSCITRILSARFKRLIKPPASVPSLAYMPHFTPITCAAPGSLASPLYPVSPGLALWPIRHCWQRPPPHATAGGRLIGPTSLHESGVSSPTPCTAQVRWTSLTGIRLLRYAGSAFASPALDPEEGVEPSLSGSGPLVLPLHYPGWHSWQESDLLTSGLESAPTATPQELVRTKGLEPLASDLASRRSAN